jgi:hypothetical protein
MFQTMHTRNVSLFLTAAFFAAAPLMPQASKVQDAKWEEVDEVSVPIPPPEHPRLYLRARDLAGLKLRATHPALKPVWDDLQSLARTNVQVRLEVDAARYLMERDPELGKRTIALALATLEQSNFPLHVQDITRPIGRMMVTGAIVYDWCYPLLTAEQKKAFMAQFIRLAQQLECGYPPRQFGWVTGHGSEWMVMRDMLSAGIAIYDEDPEMYRHAAVTTLKWLVPARNWWYPGHAFHQGSAYAETRFSSDLYPLWIFDRLGAGNVYHPSQQFVPYQWIYMRRPDGQLLRSGDGQSKEPKLRSLLSASYYGDGYVLSDYLRNPGIDGMHKLFELLWSDPDLKPLPIPDLPLSRYMGFPYGWMVARTGWDEDSVIAEMKVNVYNFTNHQHLDAGSFQIYYKGPLAVDSGNYTGTSGAYGSPHHSNYYRRTIAHNTLLIYDPEEKFVSGRSRELRNDGGQRLPNNWIEPRNLDVLLSRGYKTGKVLGHGYGPDPQTPEYTYLKGDISEAYSEKVRDVRRSFVFLNLGGTPAPAALIVFDKVVTSNAAFKKYWLLHSMEEPVVRGNSVEVNLTDRGWSGRMINTTLMPGAGSTEITKVGGPGKEFWVFGENFPNDVSRGDPKTYELGSWRVELSPRAASATDYFLNVMQVTDRDAGELPAPERLESGDLVGVRLADRVVFFHRSGDRTARPLSFHMDGNRLCKYLITDLEEGAWQVWHNGRILHAALVVSGDAGTLYFEGPAGSYSLRR